MTVQFAANSLTTDPTVNSEMLGMVDFRRGDRAVVTTEGGYMYEVYDVTGIADWADSEDGVLLGYFGPHPTGVTAIYINANGGHAEFVSLEVDEMIEAILAGTQYTN